MAPTEAEATEVRGVGTHETNKRERGSEGGGDLAAMPAGNARNVEQQEDGSPSKKTRLQSQSPPTSPNLPPSTVPDMCGVSPMRSSPLQRSAPSSPVGDLNDFSPAVANGGVRGGVAPADVISMWGLSSKGSGVEEVAMRFKEEDALPSASVRFVASRAILDL